MPSTNLLICDAYNNIDKFCMVQLINNSGNITKEKTFRAKSPCTHIIGLDSEHEIVLRTVVIYLLDNGVNLYDVNSFSTTNGIKIGRKRSDIKRWLSRINTAIKHNTMTYTTKGFECDNCHTFGAIGDREETKIRMLAELDIIANTHESLIKCTTCGVENNVITTFIPTGGDSDDSGRAEDCDIHSPSYYG
jgi:hypothetical protein